MQLHLKYNTGKQLCQIPSFLLRLFSFPLRFPLLPPFLQANHTAAVRASQNHVVGLLNQVVKKESSRYSAIWA